MISGFSLRAPCPDDATELHQALNDTIINHALIDLKHPYPMNDVVKNWITDAQPQNQFVMQMGDAFVGYIWFTIDEKETTADLSFFLVPQWRDQGIGKAALTALMPMLKNHLMTHWPSLRQIHAYTRPENRASQTILTACGFTHSVTREMPCPALGQNLILSLYHSALQTCRTI